MFRTKGLANAILTACEFVGKDKGTTTAVIAEKYELPLAYSGKIMSQLANRDRSSSSPRFLPTEGL